MSTKAPKSALRFADSAFREHEGALRRYLMRRLRSGQDARDLAQEVWARLLRVQDPDRVVEPLAYVHRTASNVLAEFYMRQKRDPVDFDSEAMSYASEHPEHLPTDEMDNRLHTQRQVQRVLAQLPTAYRHVLLMRLFEGRSYQEIGEALGLSTTTTEKYFFRAMSAVRAAKWD